MTMFRFTQLTHASICMAILVIVVLCNGCGQAEKLPRIGSVYEIIKSPLMSPTPAIAKELAVAIKNDDQETVDRLQNAELIGTQKPPSEEQFQRMEEQGLMTRRDDSGLALMVMEVSDDTDGRYAACRLLFHGDDLTEEHVYVPLIYFSQADLRLKE